MQKQKAISTCRVEMGNAKPSSHKKVLSLLSSKVRIGKVSVSQVSSGRSTATIDVEYGPVWGNWESDIRNKFHFAIDKAGSTCTLYVTNFNRKVIENR